MRTVLSLTWLVAALVGCPTIRDFQTAADGTVVEVVEDAGGDDLKSDLGPSSDAPGPTTIKGCQWSSIEALYDLPDEALLNPCLAVEGVVTALRRPPLSSGKVFVQRSRDERGIQQFFGAQDAGLVYTEGDRVVIGVSQVSTWHGQRQIESVAWVDVIATDEPIAPLVTDLSNEALTPANAGQMVHIDGLTVDSEIGPGLYRTTWVGGTFQATMVVPDGLAGPCIGGLLSFTGPSSIFGLGAEIQVMSAADIAGAVCDGRR